MENLSNHSPNQNSPPVTVREALQRFPLGDIFGMLDVTILDDEIEILLSPAEQADLAEVIAHVQTEGERDALTRMFIANRQPKKNYRKRWLNVAARET